MAPDPAGPAAILARWREAAEASTEPDDVAFLVLAADAIPRLVAAVEAAWSLAANAQVVRAAITRELTGAAHGQAPKRAPCKRIGGCLAEIGARAADPNPGLWKCSCGRTPQDITAALAGKEAGDGDT
jgi:hypothetical protein